MPAVRPTGPPLDRLMKLFVGTWELKLVRMRRQQATSDANTSVRVFDLCIITEPVFSVRYGVKLQTATVCMRQRISACKRPEPGTHRLYMLTGAIVELSVAFHRVRRGIA